MFQAWTQFQGHSFRGSKERPAWTERTEAEYQVYKIQNQKKDFSIIGCSKKGNDDDNYFGFLFDLLVIQLSGGMNPKFSNF